MAKLGNYSLKKFGVIFTVFLFKAWPAVWCFHTGAMLPVCVVTASLAQLHTHPILSSTLWPTVGERGGITYTASPVLLALTWSMKICVLVAFLSKEHFWIECLCLNLALRLCRADTRLEDSVFLTSLGVQILYPGLLGRKTGKGVCTRVLSFAVSLWNQEMRMFPEPSR